MPKFEDNHTERLFYTTSTDETRLHLSGVHMDKDLQMAVSTDGHRLYACKKWFSKKWEGTTWKIKPFIDGDRVALEHGKFPNVKQLIPRDDWDYSMRVHLPKWLAKFKKWSGRHNEVLVCLNAITGMVSIATEKMNREGEIYFNANLIASLADHTVEIFFSDKLSPLLVTEAEGSGKATDNEWFYVVMPMRASDNVFRVKDVQCFKDDELNNPITEENMDKKEEKVLSIMPAINKKNRTTCNECNHKVESEDDWAIGCDLPPSREFPNGTQDSGIYVCPECDALQDHTVFDVMVQFNPETGDLNTAIPGSWIDELCNAEYEEGSFNIGNAIINAARLDVLERYGKKAVDVMFPGEREYLMEKIKEMKL